jgi:hypothetical protein
MQGSSLRDSIRALEEDLTANPMRISAYHDLPFAILRYDPEEEWILRREVKYLATRLHIAGKQVHTVSLAELLWEAIDDAEGLEALAQLERDRGFEAAQEQVTIYLWSKPQEGCGVSAPGGGHGAGYLPHVQFARQDAGEDGGAHGLVLPRHAGGDHGAALHGAEGTGDYR